MEKLKKPHWTSSTHSFVSKISSDFVLQIEQQLDRAGLTHAHLASLLKVTDGSVSQTMNRPPNFKLSTLVEYARALGLKVSVVAYDDGDPSNERGPINSEIFFECWKKAGSPIDFFGLANCKVRRIDKVEQKAANEGYRMEHLSLVTPSAATN